MTRRSESWYTHLLEERELHELRSVFGPLPGEKEEVLVEWHRRYADDFGEWRTLSETAFIAVYGRDLDGLLRGLAAGDDRVLEATTRATGRELAAHRVPFAEIVAASRLLDETLCSRIDGADGGGVAPAPVGRAIARLRYCRLILLADSYYTERDAETGARIEGLEKEADDLARGLVGRAMFHRLVGHSSAMQDVYEQIEVAARGYGSVLIVGETGTGKELAATALHERGAAPGAPLVAVNCANLPRELVESELFGHRKGAFTGADREYFGLIRSASGGTLFLDEITEMPLESQAKLLRALAEHRVRPVGSARGHAVEVRFLASTNRDPRKAVESGQLREDLFYRLNVHTIDMPPLRDRIEDVPALAEHFLGVIARRRSRPVATMDANALDALSSYLWPGNVRELRNAVEHAEARAGGDRIGRAALPAYIVSAGRRPAARPAAPAPIRSLRELEDEHIERALQMAGGNKAEAARTLGISRHRLYENLRRRKQAGG